MSTLYEAPNATEVTRSDAQELKALLVFWNRVAGMIIVIVGNPLNILVMRTFLRIGLKDSATFIFFNLAICDFFILLGGLVNYSFYYIDYTKPFWLALKLALDFPNHYLWVLRRLFFEVNSILTLFLAAQRCLCVLMPIRFKLIFSRQRIAATLYVMWAFTAVSCAIKCYLIIPAYDPLMLPNSTKIYKYKKRPYIAHLWKIGTDFNNYMDVFVRPVFSVCVSVCVVFMVYYLRKSVKFRQLASNSNNSSQKPATGKDSTQLDKATTEAKGTASNASSPKETLVVIQVSLLCVIYLVTTVPSVICSYSESYYYPIYPLGSIASSMMFRFSQNLMLFNSGINFFIYYRFNTKFRQLCFRRKGVT